MDIFDDSEYEEFQSKWRLGGYENLENGCEKCGRSRVCKCPNGKHRCEKCNWCPEEKRYVNEPL